MPIFSQAKQDIRNTFQVTEDKSGSLTAPLYPAETDGLSGMASLTANTISLISDGIEVLRGIRANNGVNYINFQAAAAGSSPALASEGADTNIDLQLLGKGTGVLRFGSASALAGEVLAGYITIKDRNGTSRKIAIIA